jgi:hypothetical protein
VREGHPEQPWDEHANGESAKKIALHADVAKR